MMRRICLHGALLGMLAVAMLLPAFAAAQEPEFPQQGVTLAGALELPFDAPDPPAELKMRQAVEALGMNPHQFVQCRLRNGSTVTGAITRTGEKGLTISQGALGSKLVSYAQLKEAPQPVPAPGEHVLVGLEWAGLVGLCVVLSPVILVAWPLGLVSD